MQKRKLISVAILILVITAALGILTSAERPANYNVQIHGAFLTATSSSETTPWGSGSVGVDAFTDAIISPISQHFMGHSYASISGFSGIWYNYDEGLETSRQKELTHQSSDGVGETWCTTSQNTAHPVLAFYGRLDPDLVALNVEYDPSWKQPHTRTWIGVGVNPNYYEWFTMRKNKVIVEITDNVGLTQTERNNIITKVNNVTVMTGIGIYNSDESYENITPNVLVSGISTSYTVNYSWSFRSGSAYTGRQEMEQNQSGTVSGTVEIYAPGHFYAAGEFVVQITINPPPIEYVWVTYVENISNNPNTQGNETSKPQLPYGSTVNSGSMPAPQRVRVVKGSSYTISSARPTSTVPGSAPWTFINWKTGETSGTAYARNQVISALNSDLTLYAQWTPPTPTLYYIVDYDPNGGIEGSEPGAQTKEHDIPLQLSSQIPRHAEGWRFLGWARTPDGPVEFSPSSWYTENHNQTLYAKWEPVGGGTGGGSSSYYTVTYHANGGTWAPESQIKYPDVNLALSSQPAVWSGHTFQGWALRPAGGVRYNPGAIYTQNANLDLYAVWDSPTGPSSTTSYTVTYHINIDNRGDYILYESIPSGSSHTVIDYPSGWTVPNGYTFSIWSTTPTGNNYYGPGQGLLVLGDTDLYARYNLTPDKTFRVAYKAYLGSSPNTSITNMPGTPSSDGYTYYDNVNAYRDANGQYTITYNIKPINGSNPQLLGAVFQNWNTVPGSTNSPTAYDPSDNYTATISSSAYDYATVLTLYTIWWRSGSYQVIYHGYPGNRSGKHTYAQTYAATTDATIASGSNGFQYTGHNFGGWYTEPDGQGTLMSGTTYTQRKTIHLYAKWTPITYTVKFFKSACIGASSTEEYSSMSLTKDFNINLDIPIITPPGWEEDYASRYIFLGE